jgi:Ca2+-binding RTX toxin-like protein
MRITALLSMAFGSVLLPRPTSAATCSVDAGVLAVALQSETAKISSKNGFLALNDVVCAGASLATIDRIEVTGGAGIDTLTISFLEGRFEPGAGAEAGVAEIEIDVDLGGGQDMLSILGTLSTNVIVIGDLGVNLNDDDDVDLTSRNVETYVVRGGNAGDLISGAGGGPTGGPFLRPLYLYGNAGDDVLVGGGAGDQLRGGKDDDTIQGGDGADLLIGGPGNDVESGDGGADRFEQGAAIDGDDALFGGDGRDTVSYALRTDPMQVYLDDVANDGCLWGETDAIASDVENAIGGAGDDTLLGSDGDNFLDGGAGEDEIDGAGGNDYLRGGSGGDTIYGNDGNDWIEGGDGPDGLMGEAGADAIFGGRGEDWIEGGEGADVMTCGDDADTAIDPDGGAAADCEWVM